MMVLAIHALGGAATALILRRHPFLAFFSAYISHYILDAIPHWHYRLKSFHSSSDDIRGGYFVFDRKFLEDLVSTGIDFGLGTMIALLFSTPFTRNGLLIIFLGAIGGVLPDFLQLIYYIFPLPPFCQLQKIHDFFHAKSRLDNYPLVGIPLQLMLGAAFILFIKSFRLL